MAIRIEIAKMWNNKLELRIGDLSGSTTSSHILKEDVLSDISDEIDILLKNSEPPKSHSKKQNDDFTREIDCAKQDKSEPK